MTQNINTIEELFLQQTENLTLPPSPGLLRKIRIRLWVSDFFSLQPKKFNIFYASIIVGSVFVFSNTNKKQKNTTKRQHETVISTPLKLEIEYGENSTPLSPQHSVTTANKLNTNENSAVKLTALFKPNNLKGCAPLKVQFTNKSTDKSQYNWDFGNGKSSTAVNPSAVFDKPGVYQIILTVSAANNTKAVYNQSIEVFEQPKALLEIDIENSDIGQRKVVFKNKSTGAQKYNWSFGDKQELIGEQQATHIYKQFGKYSVTLLAISSEGCIDTTHVDNRFIEKDYRLAFPKKFKVNTASTSNNGFYSENSSEAIFYPRNFGVQQYELTISTSNGLKVFSTQNIQQGWNGYIAGRPAPQGNYSYNAKGIYPNGQSFSIEGKVQILVEEFYQN